MTANTVIRGMYKWSPAAGSFIGVVRDGSGTIVKLDVADPTIRSGESYFINTYADTVLNYSGSVINFNPSSYTIIPTSSIPAEALTDVPLPERTTGAGNISGKITLPSTTAPNYGIFRAISLTSVSDIKVWVKNHPEISAKTDANGNFVLKNVPKAEKENGHTLEYEKIEGAEKFNGVIAEIPVVESKQIDVSKYIGPLVIKKSGVIQGKITLSDGLSPLGAEAYIAGISAMIAKADDDGSFSLMDVPAGTFNIVFQSFGYEIARQTVTVEANEIKQLSAIQLKKITVVSTLGAIEGYALASDGSPVPGALVSILSSDKTVDIGAIASATGHYKFSSIPTGKYKIVFIKDGYKGAESEVDLAASSTLKHNQNMVKIDAMQSSVTAYGLISGNVKDSATGAPIRNAVVLTVPPTRQFYTDYNGYFDFLIPPGTYTLKIQKIGYNEEQISLAIEADKVSELNATLQSKASVALVSTIVLNASSLTINAGDTTQLTATVKDSTGNILSGKPIVWSSSNSSIAEVTQSGLVTAKGAGTCNITAAVDGKNASLALTVSGASGNTVKSIKIFPETISLKLTENKQFVIFATYNDGSSKIIPNMLAAWSSSSDCLTMLEKGNYVALSPGTAVITAKFESLTSTANVTALDSTDTQPPVISHSIPAVYEAGKDLIISAGVSDNVAVAKVWLYFRTIGAADYIKVEMPQTTAGRYSYTIPSALITSDGINYYISAEDTKSPTPNKSTFPVNGTAGPAVLKPAATLSSLTLSKTTDKTNLSSTYDLTPIVAIAKYMDGTGKIIQATWTVVSGGGSISGKIYTAPQSGTQAVLNASYVENGTTVSANLTLNFESSITIVSIVNPQDINVANGAAQSTIMFPATVTAVLSDGTTTTKTVSWLNSSTPAYNATTAGTYIFTGIIEGTMQTAKINVIVGAVQQARSIVIAGTVPSLAASIGAPNRMVFYGTKHEMGVYNLATMTEIAGTGVVINGTTYTATVPAITANVTALVVIKDRTTGKVIYSALAGALPTSTAMEAAGVTRITISGVNLTGESTAIAVIAKDKAIAVLAVPVASSVTTMPVNIKSTIESAVGIANLTAITNAVIAVQTVLGSSSVAEFTKSSILSAMDISLSSTLNAFVTAVKDAAAVITAAGGATSVTVGGQVLTGTSTSTDVYNAVSSLTIVTIASIVNPADIAVVNGTALNAIGFPATVIVTKSNGTTALAAVTWSSISTPVYNATISGTYLFTGNVTGTTLTAKVNVTVGAAVQNVAAPSFSPAGGTYNTAQSVTIACATTGASIYYTTDGTIPTTSSAIYTAAINVTATTTIKAIAVKAGMTNSAVSAAVYVINNIPVILNERAVKQTNGDVIVYWDTNIITTTAAKVVLRGSIPNNADPYVFEIVSNSNSHSVTIPASYNPMTYEKVAITYIINNDGTSKEILKYAITQASQVKLSTPVISLASGTYFGAQQLSISVPQGATVKYTLDGSTPSRTNGLIYPPSQALMIRSATTLKAIAYNDGFIDSDVTSATYIIQLTINNEKAVKKLNGDVVVTWDTSILVSTAAKVLVRNSVPNPSDPAATENPISNNTSHTVTIPAEALAGTYTKLVISHIVGEEGNIKEIPKEAIAQPEKLSAPIISLASGTYFGAQSLSISGPQGATIKYTLDGSIPSPTNGMVYPPQGLMLRSAATLKAMAFKDGCIDSDVTSATYIIQLTINNETAVRKANGDIVVTWTTGIVVSTAAKVFVRVNSTPSPSDPAATENPISSNTSHSVTIPSSIIPANYYQLVISHLVGADGNAKEILKSAVTQEANPLPATVIVNPISITENSSVTSEVIVKDQYGNIMTSGFTLSYSTSNSVATVNSSGIITAGQYNVSAYSSVLTVTVTPTVGTSITASAPITVMADTVKPILTKVIARDNKNIIVTYSKKVSNTAIEITNYKLFCLVNGMISELVASNNSSSQIMASASFDDSSQKVIKITISNVGQNLISFYPNGGLSNYKYLLFVSNVTDLSSASNSIVNNSNYEFQGFNSGIALLDSFPKHGSVITKQQCNTFWLKFNNPINESTLPYIVNYFVTSNSVAQWNIGGWIETSESGTKLIWHNNNIDQNFDPGKIIEMQAGREPVDWRVKDINGSALPLTKIRFTIASEADTGLPTLSSVTSIDNKNFILAFGESVATNALNAMNYKLYCNSTANLVQLTSSQTPAANEISVSTKFCDSIQKEVQFTINSVGNEVTGYPNGGLDNATYILYVSNVQDTSYNTIIPNSNKSFVGTNVVSTIMPLTLIESFPQNNTSINKLQCNEFWLKFNNPINESTLPYIVNYFVTSNSVSQWNIGGWIELKEGGRKLIWHNNNNDQNFDSGKIIEVQAGREPSEWRLKDINGSALPLTKIRFNVQ